MIEPTVWMQLGISDDRYRIIDQEIQKIVKTRKRIGDMALLVRDCPRFTDDEKLYAMFVISKHDIIRKLMDVAPFATQVLKDLVKED